MELKNFSTQDLVNSIAEKLQTTKKDAELIVSTVVESIAQLVTQPNAAGLRVNKLGTFKVAKRAPRTGHNPKTGDALEIGETATLTLSASQELRDRVKAAHVS
jgi:DNA-binding protein HU-beta